MQQLSGTDAGFLIGERGNNFNHVAGLALYDPATAPGGEVRFKDILAHFDARMHQNPFWRRRLVAVPGGIDRPYWVDTPSFDVEFHVRHIALPAPGDWRQLMIQVARLHSRPLDRSRPLWEMYVIGGLDNIPGLPQGCFALFWKMHHAAVDGMASMYVMRQMHTTTPEPCPHSDEPRVVTADRPPGVLELAGRALLNNTRRGSTLARFAAATTTRAVRSLPRMLDADAASRKLLGDLAPAPVTRFSDKISPHRVIEGVGIPMAAVKALRTKVANTTVNDVFLAVVSGALRRYLAGKDELPAQSLAAMMPISLRSDASAGGNSVGAARTLLHTDIEDPIERLKACSRSAAKQKDANSVFSNELPLLSEQLPNGVSYWLLTQFVARTMNTVVSNVRGPSSPLYLAGAQMQRLYPISIHTDGIGINHTGLSYEGHLWLGVVSCRNMLPDPAVYAQCIRDSFNELLQAAGLEPVAGPAFDNGVDNTNRD